ncbi:MAG: hypothetical protein K8S99_03190 [Planctomycetes bacterium]|nr:hypothetical protein [Planctomycetota bacterium]
MFQQTSTNWTTAFLIAASLGYGYGMSGGAGSTMAAYEPAPQVQPQQPLSDNPSATPPPAPAEEQPEVLTRGPVNESFAEPVEVQTQGGLVAPIAPPAGLNEAAPAERPEGDHIVWIPGYWAWDADRNGYIWTTGCWRVAPPGMSWVPGYWEPVAGGFEWVPGFWTPAGSQEIEYLPAPPVISDAQPPAGPPPSVDVIWVPPCYYWNDGRYIIRNGYWLTPQVGWVWVPSYYHWTPRGYVFLRGHWDYPLERRGVLFAPVYVPPRVHVRAGFVFSPNIVLSLDTLTVSLFAYPRYSHYYFGDYYDDVYVSVGIYPWFDCHRVRTWYDPCFEYRRWHGHKTEKHWVEHERHEYDRRRADKNLRPPRTYREMEARVAKAPPGERRSMEVARPFNKVVAEKNAPTKFQPVSNEARQRIARQSADQNNFRDARTRWENSRSAPATAQTDPRIKSGSVPLSDRGGSAGPAVPDQNPGAKNPFTQYNQRNGATAPTGPQAPQQTRREPGAAPSAPADNRGNQAKSTDRATPSMPQAPSQKDSSTPSERVGPTMPRGQSSDRGDSPSPSAAKKDSAGKSSADRANPFFPPRSVPLTGPERVKIPTPPISDKPSGGFGGRSSSDGNPPSRPSSEENRRGGGSDSHRGDSSGSGSGSNSRSNSGDNGDSRAAASGREGGRRGK